MVVGKVCVVGKEAKLMLTGRLVSVLDRVLSGQ